MIARVLLCAGWIGFLAGCNQTVASGQEPPARTPGTADEPRSIQETFGIVPLGMRLTAAGYALDFRYRVIDAEKAAPLLVRRESPDPRVVVEKSGAVLRVPFSQKVGSMRQSVGHESQVRADRNYFILFANPARHVKTGDRVTIEIGDFREHVTVQ
jgi:hypothetical protein